MSNKKIFIVCPEIKTPTGGVKQLYKLGDILRQNHYDVAIVHNRKKFKINWFSSNVNIVHFPFLFFKIQQRIRKPKKKYIFKDFFINIFINKKLPPQDSIIIYPEVYGSKIDQLLPNNYIIYNQNCYYTFDKFTFLHQQLNNTYSNNKNLGIMCVSQDSYNYLQKAFPNKNLQRIKLGLNPLFSFCDKKEKVIAFMPRKLKEDLNQIYQILVNNPQFKFWKWQSIDNCTEDEVSEILKKSAIFLSCNYNEGFGLPPLEAMACGCYVIGYAGNGGSEYFKPEFTDRIEDRNIYQFVSKLEEKVTFFNENPLSLIALGKKASEFVSTNYTLKEETETTLKAVKNILDKST